MLLLQFGNMGKELAQYNTSLFADKRDAAARRGLFAEWEDRWWPQPMPGAARAPLSPFQPPALAAE